MRYELISAVVNTLRIFNNEEELERLDEELLTFAHPNLTKEEVSYVKVVVQGMEKGIPSLYCMKKEDNELLAEVITESIHQSHDGYDEVEKVIIEYFLRDLEYAIHQIKLTK